MKAYIIYPLFTKDKYGIKSKYKHIPLILGLRIVWNKYEFSLPDYNKSFFPKGDKEGKHIFSFHIILFYYSVSIIFYNPKKQKDEL